MAAVGGPAAWPWYLIWGSVLLGACPGPQRSGALVLAIVVSVFLIKPNGILALPLPSAPAVMAVYLALAGLFWYSRRGGRGSGHRGAAGGLGGRAAGGRGGPRSTWFGAADSHVVRAG